MITIQRFQSRAWNDVHTGGAFTPTDVDEKNLKEVAQSHSKQESYTQPSIGPKQKFKCNIPKWHIFILGVDVMSRLLPLPSTIDRLEHTINEGPYCHYINLSAEVKRICEQTT